MTSDTVDSTTTDDIAEIELSNDDAFALLYRTFCFLVCLYVFGDLLCQKCLRIVPPLVGQIVVGLVFGPAGADWLITPSAHLMLSVAGELGLVLMLCQAGCQMDLPLLQRTGVRSVIMAITGSLLPTAIGFCLAYFVVLEERGDWQGALAVGCSFGPTSAGIALTVLEQCQVLQTPVGQLVVAVAIVDDILALVVLSQLQALAQANSDSDTDSGGGVEPSDIIIPIISAILWLGVGVFVAMRVMPRVLDQFGVWERTIHQRGWVGGTLDATTNERQAVQTDDETQGVEDGEVATRRQLPVTLSTQSSLMDDQPMDELSETDQDQRSTSGNKLVAATEGNASTSEEFTSSLPVYYATVLLVILLPATYYTEASYFLGAFLSGLCLATHATAALELSHYWKTVTDWLMRVFFGATIAFAIPVNLWWEQPNTLAYGCLLALSLVGKLAVGPLMTPVLTNEEEDGGGGDGDDDSSTEKKKTKWNAAHVRDCLITGCSMAGEAEFAFVVAAFGLDQGLISESVYASVTFAILLSTIVSPVLLRLVLAYTTPPTS